MAKFFQLIIFLIYNSYISGKCAIGEGTFLLHNGVSVFIHDAAEIGRDCRIGMHATIVGQGPYKHVAKIGNNVWIGPNVTIQGPVIIEDGAVISPGSVVNKSVPRNAIVAGVPARIIGNTADLPYDIMKNESSKDGYRPFLQDSRNSR